MYFFGINGMGSDFFLQYRIHCYYSVIILQKLRFDLKHRFIFLNSVSLEKHLLPIILPYTIYWHINVTEKRHCIAFLNMV